MAQESMAAHDQGSLKMKQTMTISQAMPRVRWMDFMSVERGSMPTAETSLDQGPSWPANCPLPGVT